jgi:hypothetical protein
VYRSQTQTQYGETGTRIEGVEHPDADGVLERAPTRTVRWKMKPAQAQKGPKPEAKRSGRKAGTTPAKTALADGGQG